MSKKIIGVTVGTPISVSKIANELNPATEGYVEEKILDLVQGRRIVRYADDAEMARQAEFAVNAERDAHGTVIHENYTSKSEFISHLQDIDEGRTRIVVKDANGNIPLLGDDETTIQDRLYVAVSGAAVSNHLDDVLDIIGRTYATKDEVGDINTALDSILAIQNSLIGGDA